MSGNKKTTYHMWDKWIETKTTQELSTWARVNISTTEEVVATSKGLIKDIVPGVWVPNKDVLNEWGSKEHREKMKKSWRPNNA